MRIPFTSGRRAGAAALLVALVALGGAVAGGNAAPSNGVSAAFTVLNDVSATIPGQPTPGGNVGYDVVVTNGGTSTINHVVLTQSIGSAGSVVFIKATG